VIVHLGGVDDRAAYGDCGGPKLGSGTSRLGANRSEGQRTATTAAGFSSFDSCAVVARGKPLRGSGWRPPSPAARVPLPPSGAIRRPWKPVRNKNQLNGRVKAMSKRLETVNEVARNRGLPERRLYELVKYAKDHPGEESNIPFIQVGSRIYFREAALDDWFECLEAVA
jgi:hypothetical protein